MVPELIEGKYSDKCTKTHVAEAVVLEYSKEKELFLFPGQCDIPMKGTCMTNLRQRFRLKLRIKMKIEICKVEVTISKKSEKVEAFIIRHSKRFSPKESEIQNCLT